MFAHEQERHIRQYCGPRNAQNDATFAAIISRNRLRKRVRSTQYAIRIASSLDAAYTSSYSASHSTLIAGVTLCVAGQALSWTATARSASARLSLGIVSR